MFLKLRSWFLNLFTVPLLGISIKLTFITIFRSIIQPCTISTCVFSLITVLNYYLICYIQEEFCINNRELKQWQWQWQQKHHFKFNFSFLQLFCDYFNLFNVKNAGVEVKKMKEKLMLSCTHVLKENLNFSHFMLSFCRGQQRNVAKCTCRVIVN